MGRTLFRSLKLMQEASAPVLSGAGLAMLAYVIRGDRLDGFKRDVNRATDGIFAGCRGALQPPSSHHRAFDSPGRSGTRADLAR
jgi:hypothetical protein